MHCTKCSKAPPAGATHCPYCGAPVAILEAEPMPNSLPDSSPQPATAQGKIFCVKCGAELQPHAGFCTKCGTTRANVNFQQPQLPMSQGQPMNAMPGQLICPRCGSTNVMKAKTAQWAMITAIVGFFVICALSLLFLLVKDPNRCLNCGYTF